MAGGNLTLRDSLLPLVDSLRALPDQFGLRLFQVAIVKRTWEGDRVGLGGSADTTNGLKVDLGLHPVKVRMLSAREVVASAGLFTDQDLEIGPITPPFVGSVQDADAISIFDPPVGGSVELWFNIKGPGYAIDGDWFKKIKQDTTKPFRYMFVVRKTGEVP